MDLKALQKKWYKKLKDKGFNDIEYPLNPRQELKEYHDSFFKKRYSPEMFVQKQRYYELASQLVYTLKFNSERDKKIWAMHAVGTDYATIAKKHKVSYNTVERTIRKYETFIKRL